MSKIVVFGAGGTAGQRIVTEALNRGHEVTAVYRNPAKATDVDARAMLAAGDATDRRAVRPLLIEADAAVVAIGSATETPWVDAASAVVGVIAGMDAPRPRVIHMGGGASLLALNGTPIIDDPNFPAEYRANAEGQGEALDWYRAHATALGVQWTYVSPPPVDFAPGERRGAYRTGLDHPVVDAEGNAKLSYEDLAVAIVDEIENPQFVDTRFTVGY